MEKEDKIIEQQHEVFAQDRNGIHRAQKKNQRINTGETRNEAKWDIQYSIKYT